MSLQTVGGSTITHFALARVARVAERGADLDGARSPNDLYAELVECERQLHLAMQRLLERERQVRATLRAPPVRPARLTPRELDIIRLVAAGATDAHIAMELGLSSGTVRNYNGQIFRKLGVARRTEAAMRAVALGIVEQPNESRPPSGT
jgi:DNA-binding NarL/FixJ family response regulator